MRIQSFPQVSQTSDYQTVTVHTLEQNGIIRFDLFDFDYAFISIQHS